MARATTKRGARPAAAKAPARGRGRVAASASRAAPAPKVSKDDLRAQIEKLERTVASLRAKNRELKRASGADAGRAEELERTVAKLERKLGTGEAEGRAPAPKAPRRRRKAERDPGDAVPPGVAVEDPEPPSEEDRQVLDNMNERLSEPE